MKYPEIMNIQKYSIHDGDGIRTTVFFKGCHLKCWWCHNPESQKFTPQLMFHADRCGGCHACEQICSHHAVTVRDGIACTDRTKCELCRECLDHCVNNAREIVGKEYTISELMKEIEKDCMFYEESGGGVTLSGGEVMAQDMDYIEQLLKKLKRKGYNVAIDTCGYAPQENYERVLPYVDTFLYDIKTMDPEKHEKYMGKDNELFLSNLRFISERGARIYIRIPVIGGVNDTEEEMEAMITFLKQSISVSQINLLPYHNIAGGKYDKLDIRYKGEAFTIPPKEQMEAFQRQFIQNGFANTKIGG